MTYSWKLIRGLMVLGVEQQGNRPLRYFVGGIGLSLTGQRGIWLTGPMERGIRFRRCSDVVCRPHKWREG